MALVLEMFGIVSESNVRLGINQDASISSAVRMLSCYYCRMSYKRALGIRLAAGLRRLGRRAGVIWVSGRSDTSPF